jgi:demethylmacrocin O-methyltransferase
MMKNRLKDNLKKHVGMKYYTVFKKLYLQTLSIPFGYNLNRLACIYKSDKWGKHYYTQHYRTHFRKFKFKRIKLLEIGVGGYHYPDRGGSSIRMWKRYFPFGQIFALDIYDKSFVEERRIKIYQGSQVDKKVLDMMMNEIGEPDIIIDDGSHINEHVITTFTLLFPKLKMGGIYVIEDIETSYWPDYGGDSENLTNPSTMMNFFKSLADCLNHQEFVKDNYSPSYFDKYVSSIQFYHNLVFIFKGLNNECSSVDWDHPESILADKIYC